MRNLGVKGIHIAERDTQRSRTSQADEHLRQHVVCRGIPLRRHAAGGTRLGHARAVAAGERPAADDRLGPAPICCSPGPTRGCARGVRPRAPVRLSRHAQRVDLDRRLFHAFATARPGHLPPHLPLRLPSRRRRRALAARTVRPRRRSARIRSTSSTRTRSSTASTNWACCSTATRKTPTGTARSSRSTRPATSLPIRTPPACRSPRPCSRAWCGRSRTRRAASSRPTRWTSERCLEVQRPYLGPVTGHYTDWTPLTAGRGCSRRTSIRRSVAVPQHPGPLIGRGGSPSRGVASARHTCHGRGGAAPGTLIPLRPNDASRFVRRNGGPRSPRTFRPVHLHTRGHPMTTRRQFVQSLPAFAVAANMLDGDTAAGAPAPVAPAAGHFHPKGKPPSEFTKAVLRKARQALPFDDTRDFDEQRRGLIAPMKDLKIMADAGDVVWDMTRFQFLDQKDEFDTIHPSMHRIGQLNNNYGLYEVVPGHLPGPRLRPRPDHLRPRQDRLDRVRLPGHGRSDAGRLEAVPGAQGGRAAGHGGRLLPLPRRPLGRRARRGRRGRRRARQGARSSPRATSWTSRSRRTSSPATP